MATKTKELHPSQDREYILSQIARGEEVLVKGKTYTRANAKDLPSQKELEAGATVPPALTISAATTKGDRDPAAAPTPANVPATSPAAKK